MIQAIGALERAITRMEQAAESMPVLSAPAPSDGIDASGARAALKSLDDLITELKGRTGG